jgi:hypothetical protein
MITASDILTTPLTIFLRRNSMKTYVCKVDAIIDDYDSLRNPSINNKMILLEFLLKGRLFSISSDEPVTTIAQRFAVGLMGELQESMSYVPSSLPPNCFKLSIALLGSLRESGHGGVGLTEYFWRYHIDKNGEVKPI